jgi:hypothetical protein
MKQAQYTEGHQAHENFERTMVKLFRATKPNGRKQPKAASARKTKKADKD